MTSIAGSVQALSNSPFSSEAPIARWELWSVANMLVTIHGAEAEKVAVGKLRDAEERLHEGDEIVWTGIVNALARIRDGQT